MSLGATFRQTSPDRVGISAKAPQATAKEVVLKRQLSDLSKEFNALDKQHNKATTKVRLCGKPRTFWLKFGKLFLTSEMKGCGKACGKIMI